jgi:hypothetical protein
MVAGRPRLLRFVPGQGALALIGPAAEGHVELDGLLAALDLDGHLAPILRLARTAARSAYCFGIGEGAGIWSFVVLMNADARSAFR